MLGIEDAAVHDLRRTLATNLGAMGVPDNVIERTEGVVGFFGASSMERLPTEIAMTENMRRFKAIPV